MKQRIQHVKQIKKENSHVYWDLTYEYSVRHLFSCAVSECTLNEMRVFLLLRELVSQGYHPTHQELADFTLLHVRTIDRMLKRFKQKRLIRTKKFPVVNKRGQLYYRNRFTFNPLMKLPYFQAELGAWLAACSDYVAHGDVVVLKKQGRKKAVEFVVLELDLTNAGPLYSIKGEILLAGERPAISLKRDEVTTTTTAALTPHQENYHIERHYRFKQQLRQLKFGNLDLLDLHTDIQTSCLAGGTARNCFACHEAVNELLGYA